MPELALLRHAKSDWGDPGLADHDRPLAARGQRAAPGMGRHLVEDDCAPDLVLCSSSRRTRETWELIESVLADSGLSPELRIIEELYLASPRTMIDLIREHGGGAERVMVIGHNPGTHDLAIALCATGDDHLLDRLERKFPTGALARVEFRGDDWNTARAGVGHLVDFVRPKDLPAADELDL